MRIGKDLMLAIVSSNNQKNEGIKEPEIERALGASGLDVSSTFDVTSATCL